MGAVMVTLLLDVDGVLVGGRPQDGAHLFTDLEKDLGISTEALQRGFFFNRWEDIVTGRKAIIPELTAALKTLAPEVSAEELLAYWLKNDSRIDQAVLADVDELRGAGHKVFLATNQEHRRADYLMKDMGLGAHVDGIFYSADLGARKPDRGFYLGVSEQLGAETPVFVDDNLPNVQAARAFGWRAHQWLDGLRLIDLALK
jgi:putative hydrolase of the HAD superfamily